MDEIATFDGELSFLDPETNRDPFPAYAHLLDERPIYFDPVTRFHVVTRYDDIRTILMDPKTFSSASLKDAVLSHHEDDRAKLLKARFVTQGGFVPPPNIASTDDPRHRQIRAMFDKAFRPNRIKLMDDDIRETAATLVEAFAHTGSCDIVRAFSIPYPMTVIFNQVGARTDDIWLIKGWLNSLIARSGFFQTPEDQVQSVDDNVRAQLYFKDLIGALRKAPNETFLSDLINGSDESGAALSEEELITNIIDIIFLAGTETTTNSVSAGILKLCEAPELFQRLKADPERISGFVEEVLRLESPAQGIFRVITREVEMQGVKLEPGAVLHLRVGAANRDDRRFGCPAQLDVNRKNSSVHLAFGAGIHHCVGNVLARRELYWAFRTIVERFRTIRLAAASNGIAYLQSYMFRSINELDVELEPM